MKLRIEDIEPEIHHTNYFELGSIESWGPRTIQDYEFIYILSGEFRYEVKSNGETLVLKPGDILCIPPGELHVFALERRIAGKAGISCLHLDFLCGRSRLAGDYELEQEPPRLQAGVHDARVHMLFKGISEAYRGYGAQRHGIAKCMAKELMLRLAELWSGTSGRPSERAREMAACIEEDLSRRVGRRELARRFGLSPARVDCIFKAEFGATPTKFLHSARAAKACSLLLDKGMSVKEAADELGFFDEAHFSKVFKRQTGMPPSRLMPVKSSSKRK